MALCNGPGRPPDITEEIIERIIENVPKVVIQNQVAHLSKVPKSTMDDWLKRGIRDSENGINSLFAQFSERFKEAQAKVASECITFLRHCPKNYGALTFILERCFKDDFETKSDAQKQLEDYVDNVIKPLINKGEIIHGKEIQKSA